jgi:hypothetical protein
MVNKYFLIVLYNTWRCITINKYELMFNRLAKYTLVIRISLPHVPHYMNNVFMTFEYGVNSIIALGVLCEYCGRNEIKK